MFNLQTRRLSLYTIQTSVQMKICCQEKKVFGSVQRAFYLKRSQTKDKTKRPAMQTKQILEKKADVFWAISKIQN